MAEDAEGGFEPPEEFEEYRLLRPLGRGAMGQVYLGHDMLLDRPVAVKFIAGASPSAAARERFFIEARALARLSHPNVVSVHRVGEVRRRPFLVSELLRGQTLSDLPRPMAEAAVLRIGIALSRGLSAAHRRGVLHRDVKPQNAILTEEGEAKLLDFGLAKILADDGADLQPNHASQPVRKAPAAIRTPVPFDQTIDAHNGDGRTERAAPGEGSTLQLTGQGALVGSPLYMAPELWNGAAATRQADVYSLGVVLYELCAGRTPFSGATLDELRERVLGASPPPLRTSDERLAAVIERCLHRDLRQRYDSGDALREALERLLPPVLSVPPGNPYRGLLRFEAEHRGLFFGRGAEVRALLDRLRSDAFVLVAGDSGVGKSSLCRAGVLPLFQGAVLRLLPGRRPLLSLAAALAPFLGRDEGSIFGELRQDPSQLGRMLRPRGSVLLFLDQMEELFTLSDPAEAALLSEALSVMVLPGSGAPRILCTARTDFLSRLCELPALGIDVPRALWLLSPLPIEGLREAVLGPARAKGFSFESEELVAELSAAGQGGALPLLQFALAELWEARDEERSLVTREALSRLGGVAGALGRHGDGVLRRLLPPERICARRLLLGLVTSEGTRSRKDEAELLGRKPEPAARAALDALVAGRILLATVSDEGCAVYELAHEALIYGWEALRNWLAGDAEQRALRQRLAYAAGEWRRLDKSEEALWRTRQLEEAQVLRDGDLQSREVAFVVASRRAVERSRRLRRLLLGMLPMLLLLGVGGIHLLGRRQLSGRISVLLKRAQAELAVARREAALSAAEERASLGHFDARQKEAGEVAWAAALTHRAAVDRARRQAGQLLESALQLDGSRSDAKAFLADVLFDRAEAAAKEQRYAERDELLGRLALYDLGGARRKRLVAPAQLTLELNPADAALHIERLELEHTEERYVAVPIGTRGQPIRDLIPGIYRLDIQAPGRAPVRQILHLAAAEERREVLSLPAAAAVPAGMVYLPAGEFLFGSAAEELRRGFLGTVPLRPARTQAFLIAIHETSFAEWIEFLQTLPSEDRARRLPRVGGTGMHGGLELRELPDGAYLLRYQPTSVLLQARAGEHLRYPGRLRHAKVDWRKAPVAGVSAEDAAAYAAWLQESGRVPGARLCTEYEWERAARGADGREYPNGPGLLPDDANYDATHGAGLGLCEVGSHPAGRSPFGIDDMAGNVWEWVVPTISAAPFMTRGGGYYYGDVVQRCTNRHEPEPTLRDATVGLRICADAPVSLR